VSGIEAEPNQNDLHTKWETERRPERAAVVSVRRSRYRRCCIVRVMVNDEPRVLASGATVADLVAALGLGPRRIAVELNHAVVPRAEYEATALHDGDAVEIIHFVGGG
jgi:thiamine biosynthesis protein ThiS